MQPKLVSLAVAAAFASTAGIASAQTVVKIGHVAPTTRAIARPGTDKEIGAQRALAHLNATKTQRCGKAN